MRQIPAVSLLGYEDVAASVGLDGAILLRRVGISKEALGDPENRIPTIAVAELLEISATLSGREDFGLLTARRRQFAHLGPVSMLLAHLPNLREMVKVSIDYQRHFNDIVGISLEEDGDGCLIKLALDPGFGRDQVVDQTIGVAHRVLIGASGGGWRPECVHLTRHPLAMRDPGGSSSVFRSISRRAAKAFPARTRRCWSPIHGPMRQWPSTRAACWAWCRSMPGRPCSVKG